jgi:hypothetical protein
VWRGGVVGRQQGDDQANYNQEGCHGHVPVFV